MVENLSRPVLIDGYPTLRTVEFSDDEWNTIHEGSCVESSAWAYLIDSPTYGRHWIPKARVRLKGVRN